uniref:Uncharacterized protein n=1 Tax=Avena sativa TaxID=4498 RepID=A0ACD5V227_AVESA
MATAVRDFPTDALVEILLRLPPSSLRRSRLVCRLWRDAIDERTTEMRSRAKALLWNPSSSVAYVVDDLSSSSSTGTCRELWRRDGGNIGDYVQLVGTSNGLLCLCNDNEIGGAITLVNPATGEALPLPPLPCASRLILLHHRKMWHAAYSFAYHPTSGRYKLVHVPCIVGRSCEFRGVRVLTLGEVAWREVPVGHEGGARCNLGAGVVSIDGTTHWVTDGAAPRIVSFDLDDERITSVTALPGRPAGPDLYNLTEVHGRLGIVIHGLPTDVWVMEEGRRWCRRYSVNKGHYLSRMHLAYGEYVLTVDRSNELVYRHHRRKGSLLPGDVVRVNQRDEGTLVANVKIGYSSYSSRNTAFTYVETTEPLSVYMAS